MSNPVLLPDRWAKLKSTFEAAVLREEKEWTAFIASSCGGDTELADEVYRLLVADRDASRFLDEPVLRLNDLIRLSAPSTVLEAGRILCDRFEIVRLLGAGGMGDVYEGVDQELQQHIAIKVLRSDIALVPGALSRFKREALTTRTINHPNICRTYDLECDFSPRSPGEAAKTIFLTMELLRGETLAERLNRSGPLPARLVREMAEQIASALIAAHESGIVHRDLKPSNVFLTGSDNSLRAVVSDFGIAKLIHASDHEGHPLVSDNLIVSGFVGTPAYMAPEQLRGGECVASSDFYAFGLLVYEAIAGERLLPQDRSPRELNAKIDLAVKRLDQKNVAWKAMLHRCLEPDPTARAADGKEILALLRISTHLVSRLSMWAVSGLLVILAFIVAIQWHNTPHKDGTPHNPAVVVLPFGISAHGLDSESLSKNIALNLTNELSKYSGLKVTSQGALSGLSSSRDLHALAEKLHIDTVIEGAITETDGDLVVQVEITDAASGLQRSSQRYSRRREDMSVLMTEISEDLAFTLRRQEYPTSTRSASQRYEVSRVATANDAYRKGIEALNKNTPSDVERAAAYFQQAIDADSQYAMPYAKLAQCYLSMANNYNRPEDAPDLRSSAESSAWRAIQLDGSLAEAYSNIAKVQVSKNFDWGAAETNFRRAIDLDPSYTPAHVAYAFFLLTPEARFAEARAQYSYADRATPNDVGLQLHETLSEYYARQYDQSIRRGKALKSRYPEIELVTEILAEDYLATGKLTDAYSLLMSSRPSSPDAKASRNMMLGITLARLGRRREALRILGRIESERKPTFDFNFLLGALCAAIGKKDSAFEYLEKSYISRQTSILFLGTDPLWDLLRPDPRYQRFISRLNLKSHSGGDD